MDSFEWFTTTAIVWLPMLMLAGVLVLNKMEDNHQLLKQINREYLEYETPTRFIEERRENKWPNHKGGCSECGMDDEFVIQTYSGYTNWMCFWCTELHTLNKHLREHGIRRFK